MIFQCQDMKKLIKRIIYRILTSLLSLTGFFLQWLPTRRDLILFSQANDRYNGNSRYLFEYLCDNGFNVFWLYTSDKQRNSVNQKYHAKFIKRKTIGALFLVLRSSKAVISYGGNDLGLYWHISKWKNIFGLWHAITLKQIGILDKKITKNAAKKYLSKETIFYSKQTSSSDVDRYIASASHGIDVRRVCVTGNPKTDHFIKSFHWGKGGKASACLNILYAPTYRDYKAAGSLFFPFGNFSFPQLVAFFEARKNIKLYLRPHPDDKNSIQQAIDLERLYPDNIVHFSRQVCDDVDESLWQFNVIITDYSSIYLEPLLGDTPCIFVPFDYDIYMETRGLAYDYEMVTPGPKVHSFEELAAAIDDAINGAPQWAQKRKLVTDMFFKYKDAGACKRIAEQVLGLEIKDETSA